MEASKSIVAFFAIVCVSTNFAFCSQLHYIHWNRDNPMFRLDNTDHIVDVNKGNLPWEYDQANIICPVSKPGARYPEKHVIYSVSREEFDSCRITNPKPKIVAIGNQPHRLMYFTITFRSFTPTPGSLEYQPGQDYYFISTSSKEDLHRRVGGGCATHNMKMIFKVADNGDINSQHAKLNEPRNDEENAIDVMEPTTYKTTTTTKTTTPTPKTNYNSKVPSMRNIYYYHPRDLIEIGSNSISGKKYDNSRMYENQVWRKKKALRLTSSSTALQLSFPLLILLPLLKFWCI
jgi:ephrin-B